MERRLRDRWNRPGRGTRTAVAVVVAVTLASGCSGATETVSDGAAEAPAMDAEGGSAGEAAPPETADHEVTEEGAGEGPEVGVGATAVALGRDRVRTAWITLELDDPEAAVGEVTAIAEARGGFVALADLTRDDRSGELAGTVTVRVPSEALIDTLDALETIAVDAPVRRIEEENVGAQLTDLRARVTNLTAYEGELRALLTEVREGSSDPDDLLPIVERLQSVRSDIDRLRARRDELAEQVALSTITITLTPTASATPIATSTWAPIRTLEEAVATTGRSLAAVADAAIWLVVTVVPLALIVGGPVVVGWRWSRRRQAAGGSGTTPTSVAPGGSSPPA